MAVVSRTNLPRAGGAAAVTKKRIVLSIDGGGVLGYLPALIMRDLIARVELLVGGPILHPGSLFDLVAGTSTGAIIAAAVAARDAEGNVLLPMTDVVALYREETPKIFLRGAGAMLRGLSRPMFDASRLVGRLQSYCGDTRLSELTTNLLIPAYDMDAGRPQYFRSGPGWRSGGDGAFLLVDVLAGATAAPLVFGSRTIAPRASTQRRQLIDGAIVLNNPSLRALTEARWLFPDDEQDMLVISIGTGAALGQQPGPIAEDWGMAQWLNPFEKLPLLQVLMQAQAAEVHDHVSQILWDPSRYVRIQPLFDRVVPAIDDPSPAAFSAMDRAFERLLQEQAERLDWLADILAHRLHGPQPVSISVT